MNQRAPAGCAISFSLAQPLRSLAGLSLSLCLLSLLASRPATADDGRPSPLQARKILFLGDSITHAGHYVAWIETQLRLQDLQPLPRILNLGLPSETCSGLSEPAHPFPRPDVHERLDRALEKVRPDLVVACYGMNDGIYYPFGEERFAAYQRGVRKLVAKVKAAGATCVLLTPPPFDPTPLRGKGKLQPADADEFAYFAVYEDYDNVLRRYGRWLQQEMADEVAMVIDLHGPVTAALEQRRKTDPDFRFAGDGVHLNAEGHRIMADAVLKAWGVESTMTPPPPLLQLVERKTKLLHDSWLTHVGHKRPGGKPGPPVKEAEQQAAALSKEIDALTAAAREPAADSRRSADGTTYHIRYPSSLQDGELRLVANYYLWTPETDEPLRAIIVHQHGCGPGASQGGRTAADDLHWQALARKWNCGLMGSMYEPKRGVNCRLWCDARRGSDARFQQALQHFAGAAGREEIAAVPWCLWGHSGGAFWSSLMQAEHPDRIVAIWLRSGTAFGSWRRGEIEPPSIPEAAYGVPVMANPGLKEKSHERFHSAWDGLHAMRETYLDRGAKFFGWAPDPRTSHECGDSRYMAVPFFDFWLEHRLPATATAKEALRPVTPAAIDAWEAALAPKLAEYVETGGVTDRTPPPPPANVRVRQLGGRTFVSWEAKADLESGIGHFLVLNNGLLLGQTPESPKGRFGRPLFQTMSYHDTPEAPLPAMEFSLAEPPGPGDKIQVVTVNSSGLKSRPSPAAPAAP